VNAIVKTKKTNGPASSLRAVGRIVDRAFDVVIDALSPEPTSATQLLVKQHTLVKKLFESIEQAKTTARKRALFEEVAQNLVAHDAIERELFYPACEKAMGMTKLLGEALVEHGVIEFCVYEADQAKERDFAFKCKVLSEIVLHHVKEEEHEFFPRVEKALGQARLDRLGAQMQARFEQAKAGDFRQAVYDNLQQVLAGTTKPKKRPAAAKRPGAGKAAAKRPRARKNGATKRKGARARS
jgi:hemerythrin superfamily protein